MLNKIIEGFTYVGMIEQQNDYKIKEAFENIHPLARILLDIEELSKDIKIVNHKDCYHDKTEIHVRDNKNLREKISNIIEICEKENLSNTFKKVSRRHDIARTKFNLLKPLLDNEERKAYEDYLSEKHFDYF